MPDPGPFMKAFSDDTQHPYTLAYEYFLAGGLKSVDGPFHHKTTYAADTLGRITKIGAAGNSNLSGDTAYASDIKYRAFGAVKEMKLSTTAQTTVSMTYDDALRPASYLAHNTVSGDIQSSSYVYSGDGMNKQITNGVHSEFNQISQYDFAGRLKKNDVGHSGATYPFKQTMSYDPFDNLTARETYTWQDYHDDFSATYANNRKTSGGTTDYSDSAGNVVQSNFYTHESPGGGRSYNDLKNWTFDAAGRMAKWDELGPWEAFPQTHSAETTYDGDGRPVMTTIVDDGGTFPWRYIFSSVTGQKIADVSPGYDPAIAANIYMGGSQIAQERDTNNTFDLHDPVTGSVQLMQPSGTAITSGQQSEMYPYHTEMAGLGTAVPVDQPTAFPQPLYPEGGFPVDAEGGCRIDGVLFGPGTCSRMAADTVQCPDNNCGPRRYRDPNTGKTGWTFQFEVRGNEGGYSISDGTGRFVPLTDIKDEVGRVIDDAKDYLKKNTHCSDFLNRVLGFTSPKYPLLYWVFGSKDSKGRLTAKPPDVLDMLDQLKEAQITQTANSGRVGGYLNEMNVIGGVLQVNRSFGGLKPEEKRQRVIHESFHLPEGVDDFDIYRAAQLAQGTKPEQLKTITQARAGLTLEQTASFEFNQIVSNHCPVFSIDPPGQSTFRY